MDNHYHGIVQTPDANLSQAMQWFHGAYAAWYNARHNRVGPLFLWAARRFCGLTLREMGVAVGGMNSAAVSTALKRFERRAVEAQDLKALQARMVAMLIVEP
jgi:hypothetical protein